ncbi:ATP-dependent DNA ligase [Paenibacillus thailandensis]|uniref:ATP-dependent DNA ligase n=1 Tax=Paenibacillus thailandensis TaxID=393250 RepID=A0ABW5QUI7_9BACL
MFIAPMLPVACPEPFDDERYIFEPKLDGRRLILSFHDRKASLYNRYGHDVTRQYPELCRVPLAEPADVALDGEAVYVNPETGLMEPETVAERFRLSRETRIREAALERPLHYFVFDIVYYNGRDLRGRPLLERKRLLAKLLAGNEHIHLLRHQDTFGMRAYAAARRLKLVGIMAKRKDSEYAPERSADWLTIPHYEYKDAVVYGYRKDGFGWLLEASGEPAGMLERAVDPGVRLAFEKEARTMITGEDRSFVYLNPGIGIRIKFRGLTRDGLPRKPEFAAFTSSLPVY